MSSVQKKHTLDSDVDDTAKKKRYRADPLLDKDPDGLDENMAPAGRAKTGVTRIRARQANGGAEAGGPLLGIVERVELVDFMCHERAEVALCPKVNFITGQNGSGKSAILTALTIALGGKASATNRAPSLKEFIREGRPRSVVRVQLRNQGPDAYMPELFGSSVVVERQINSSGSATSQFRVKNGDTGETVSRKKETVVAVTDHMAIQVDNPINILSQDAAREFLASTSHDKMYHFFLKGTQLFQLRQDLEVVRQAITRAETSIERKREVLPEMKAEKLRWEQRYKDMEQARDIATDLEALSHQMAWAFVEEAEADVRKVDEDVATQRRKLSKLDEKVDAETSAIDVINREAEQLEDQARAQLALLDPLQEERRGPLEQIALIKSALRSFKQTENEINAEARGTRERIESLNRDIETERARLVDKDSSGRDRLLEAIRDQEELIAEKEADISSQQAQQKALEEQTLQLHDTQRQRKVDVDKARRDVERVRSGLQDMMRQTSDQMSAFGNGVRDAQQLIKKTKWRGMEPVGPIGRFIKLRDTRWSRVIETTLDKSLNSFLVESHADRAALDAILRRCGCQSRIIICKRELFDYSQGEPSADFVTVLRALDFSDELVKRQLINLNRIEQIILVEQRSVGDRVMASNNGGFPRNVTACLSADGYNVGARGGGLSTQAMRLVRPSSRLGEDISQAIAREKQDLAEKTRVLDEAKRALDEATRQIGSLANTHKASEAAERKSRDQINRANAEIQQTRERLQSDEPAKIAALEGELETFTTQLESIQTQFRDHISQQTAKEGELAQAEGSLALIDSKIAGVRDRESKLRRAAEKKASECQTHSSNIEYWNSKRATLEEKLRGLEGLRLEAESKAGEAESDARKVCPDRVPVKHTPRALDRKISQHRARLEEIERSSSMSLAEIAEKTQVYVSSYRKAKEELGAIVELVSALKTAHQQRLSRWTQFRDSMTVRTKLHFIKNLHQRGYTGKLEFDHTQCTLIPKVKTDQDLVSERVSKGAVASPSAKGSAFQRKDTRSLSGGEKSFTTICLLLSLWETMNCPVRALDEFDVFMDAANRKIATSMMIGSARSQKDTQFILITPQDMNVKPDADITILRLQPPRRSASTA
ncbi:Structural maintenance of chromosomes protein 6 [Coemansia sp. RSA 552]|nr:Structural maintenance of chromosomes protein 6 [Coemansia sp. RSA 552]